MEYTLTDWCHGAFRDQNRGQVSRVKRLHVHVCFVRLDDHDDISGIDPGPSHNVQTDLRSSIEKNKHPLHGLHLSPTDLVHWTILPSFMVDERAGIMTLLRLALIVLTPPVRSHRIVRRAEREPEVRSSGVRGVKIPGGAKAIAPAMEIARTIHGSLMAAKKHVANQRTQLAFSCC